MFSWTGLGEGAQDAEWKIAQIYMFGYVVTAAGKLFLAAAHKQTASKNCLIKQANMADKLCMSERVPYAKISNLIKQIYGGKYFIHIWRWENMEILTLFTRTHTPSTTCLTRSNADLKYSSFIKSEHFCPDSRALLPWLARALIRKAVVREIIIKHRKTVYRHWMLRQNYEVIFECIANINKWKTFSLLKYGEIINRAESCCCVRWWRRRKLNYCTKPGNVLPKDEF